MGDGDALGMVVDYEESRDSNSVAVSAEDGDLCSPDCHHFPAAEMTTRNSFSTIFLLLYY